MFTPEEAKNLLLIVDRALKAAPQQGGLNDHMATAVLIHKLNAIIKAEANGEDVPSTD